MQGVVDFWLGSAPGLLGQGAEQRTADDGQIGQDLRIAGTGSVLSHDCVPAPVVADFHTGPMSANQAEPLAGFVMVRFGA